MLRVHTLVVVDRAEVDAVIRIVVELQQLAHRALPIRLRAHGAEPEPEQRPPHGVREQDSERTQRHAPADPARDTTECPGAVVQLRYPSNLPRSVESWKAACARSPRASAIRAPPIGRMNIRP